MSVTVLPRVVPASERESVKPYVILAAIQVLDIVLTGFILHAWSERAEGNPIARVILETAGLPVGLAALLAFKLGVVWMLYSCQTGVKILSAIYALVIANNLYFLVGWAWLAYQGKL